MRRLTLTIRPGDQPLHPVGDTFLDPDVVEVAELYHWNIRAEQVTLLFLVYGDRERVEAVASDLGTISEYEIVPVDESCFYYYNVDEPPVEAMALFRTFTRPGLLAIPPTRWADGEVTASLLADGATLQAIVDDIPDFVDVSIDALSDHALEARSPLAALSPRQREALVAGAATGYYDVPRTGDHRAVAARLDCAPSTAAEHLQKAEAALVEAVLPAR